MKKSWTIIIIFLALLLALININFQLEGRSKNMEKTQMMEVPRNVLPGEMFIRSKMLNEDETLKTNLRPQMNTNQNIALGDETLSESIGLWLLYALEKNDQALFKRNVNVLKSTFLKQSGLIAWKLGNAQAEVSTNALIDDLRIVEALYKAAFLWEEEAYIKLANKIAQTIISKNTVDGMFVDFYDFEAEWSSQSLTLSYLNPVALFEMYQQQQISEDLYLKTIDFLQNIPMRNQLFPVSYDLEKKEFAYHEDVHLIDQLYVFYHQVQSGGFAEDFWEFITGAFEHDGLLYGRYDAQTKTPTVEYESPAVYGLAILSAIEIMDYEFAEDVYYRMLRHQTLDPESDLYGGYIDYNTRDTHIFDNLIPLLAERKMFNAGLLR